MPKLCGAAWAKQREPWSLVTEQCGFGVWPMTGLKTPGSAWIITTRCNTWRWWDGPCLAKTKPSSGSGSNPWLSNSRTNRRSKSSVNWKIFWRNCRRESRAEVVQREVNYFHEHQDRMDYRAGRRRGEPIGSGAIESTCRQAQCRFKRPGQYWSQRGDESLLCLETFRRNGRWHLLFPHNRHFDHSKN